MTHGRRGLAAVAAACLLALLGSGCTPDTPPPAPPTTSSPTPTENAQELEERLAYEAAEKSYRQFRAEYNRLARRGGINQATAKMRQTADGPYLAEMTRYLSAFKDTGYRIEGEEAIGYLRRSGYSTDSLLLDSCEDDSSVKTLSDRNKVVDKGDFLSVKLEARRVSGIWKVWSGTGEKVSSCEG